jgi:hypothetical protein
VLYALIKDELLEKNQTVESVILKNLKDKGLINSLENDCPTLTIFVPELPENSFNAEI